MIKKLLHKKSRPWADDFLQSKLQKTTIRLFPKGPGERSGDKIGHNEEDFEPRGRGLSRRFPDKEKRQGKF